MKSIFRLALPLCAAFLAGNTHATSFTMDTFAVWRNFNAAAVNDPTDLLTTVPLFYDDFTDGAPPPVAPNFTAGTPASYTLLGSMGAESGGLLTLDSSGAVDDGSGLLVQQAILNTNVDSGSGSGLKSGTTNFAVGGIFNLINPGNSVGSYGVRFTDAGAGNGNDIVSLSVHGQTDGTGVIQFSSFDSTTGIRTLLDQQALDINHEQIAVGLTYADPDGDPGVLPKAVYAAFFYLDNDVASSAFLMQNGTTLFHGETFTRAAFFTAATNPVPEPEAYAMMLAGLGLVGFAARRRAQA